MAENSKIEWTDSTWNPWIGCTKVSPGCANCYAETLMDTRYGRVKWGKGNPRSRTSESNWKLPLRWNDTAICNECGEHSKIARIAGNLGKCPVCHKDAMRRPRVFCSSLADWLDDEVPVEWLADLLALIHATPNLDWLLLTKRPQNWGHRVNYSAAYLLAAKLPAGEWAAQWTTGHHPSNIWIGTTVEDQARADLRIPELVQIPAKVRFLSCEPLLGPVNLKLERWRCNSYDVLKGPVLKLSGEISWKMDGESMIHWIISGGESGHGARPMHPVWAMALRDQCAAAGVPFLFKQWGEWQPFGQGAAYMDYFKRSILIPHGPGSTGWPMYLVGKKEAGRLIDGVEHNGFPVNRHDAGLTKRLPEPERDDTHDAEYREEAASEERRNQDIRENGISAVSEYERSKEGGE